MKKLGIRLSVCMLFALCVWLGTVVADKEKLEEELIRFHVIAASDSPEDQAYKLSVRDAVMEDLQSDLSKITDAQLAKQYLEEKLPYIAEIANRTLQQLGCGDAVCVTLQKEAFDTRIGSGGALPAGIYHTLKITIGEGKGENWWCIAFPRDYEGNASTSVFSEWKKPESEQNRPVRIRFFALDLLGKLENILFAG